MSLRKKIFLILFAIPIFMCFFTNKSFASEYYPYSFTLDNGVDVYLTQDFVDGLNCTSFLILNNSTQNNRFNIIFINNTDYPNISFNTTTNSSGSVIRYVIGYNSDYSEYISLKYYELTFYATDEDADGVDIFDASFLPSEFTLWNTSLVVSGTTESDYMTSLFSNSLICSSNEVRYPKNEELVFREANWGGDGDNGNGSGDSGDDTSDSDDDSSGWLSNIWNTLTSILDSILNLASNIANAIKSIFSPVFDFITTILDYLNPFSDNFILKSIIDFVLNFFDNFLNFVIHIFIPTDSQWEDIKSSYSDLGTMITEHIPFWSFVQSTITNAQNTDIIPNDFLIIKMPSFSYFGGQTSETTYINVLEAYEPYRIQVRGLLLLIVYVCAFVYIIKLITDYKANVDGSNGANDLKSGK